MKPTKVKSNWPLQLVAKRRGKNFKGKRPRIVSEEEERILSIFREEGAVLSAGAWDYQLALIRERNELRLQNILLHDFLRERMLPARTKIGYNMADIQNTFNSKNGTNVSISTFYKWHREWAEIIKKGAGKPPSGDDRVFDWETANDFLDFCTLKNKYNGPKARNNNTQKKRKF